MVGYDQKFTIIVERGDIIFDEDKALQKSLEIYFHGSADNFETHDED